MDNLRRIMVSSGKPSPTAKLLTHDTTEPMSALYITNPSIRYVDVIFSIYDKTGGDRVWNIRMNYQEGLYYVEDACVELFVSNNEWCLRWTGNTETDDVCYHKAYFNNDYVKYINDTTGYSTKVHFNTDYDFYKVILWKNLFFQGEKYYLSSYDDWCTVKLLSATGDLSGIYYEPA